jgi:hypothetical protein
MARHLEMQSMEPEKPTEAKVLLRVDGIRTMDHSRLLQINQVSTESKTAARGMKNRDFMKIYSASMKRRTTAEEQEHMDTIKASMAIAVAQLKHVVAVPWPVSLKPGRSEMSSDRWIADCLESECNIVLEYTEYECTHTRCCGLLTRPHDPDYCTPVAKHWKLLAE